MVAPTEPLSTDDAVFEPFLRGLPREALEAIAVWKADEKLQARLDELGDLCNEGLLTPEQREEYESYVHKGTLISIMKVYAKRILAESMNR